MDEETKELLLTGGYDPPAPGLACPNCNSNRTMFLCSILGWLCLQCGIEFDQADTIPCYMVEEYEADPRIPIEYLEED